MSGNIISEENIKTVTSIGKTILHMFSVFTVFLTSNKREIQCNIAVTPLESSSVLSSLSQQNTFWSFFLSKTLPLLSLFQGSKQKGRELLLYKCIGFIAPPTTPTKLSLVRLSFWSDQVRNIGSTSNSTNHSTGNSTQHHSVSLSLLLFQLHLVLSTSRLFFFPERRVWVSERASERERAQVKWGHHEHSSHRKSLYPRQHSKRRHPSRPDD